MNGVEVASAVSTHDRKLDFSESGIYRISFRLKGLVLVARQYYVGVGLRSNAGMEDYIREAFSFEVVPNELSAKTKADSFCGFVVPPLEVELLG